MISERSYNNQKYMSSAQVTVDHSKPRNLMSDLFSDLPAESNYPIKPNNANNKDLNSKKNKYQQNDQEEDHQIFHLNLQMQSKIIDMPNSKKNQAATIKSDKEIKVNSDIKMREQSSIKQEGKIGEIPQGPIRLQKKKTPKQHSNTNSKQKLKSVPGDQAKIDEVQEWESRNTRNTPDQDDFDNDTHPKQLDETQEQLQIRKKLEEKIKTGAKSAAGGLKGLQAKADELKRKNQQKLKSQQQSTIQLAKEIKEKEKTLKAQKIQNQKILNKKQNGETEDDPWEKVNNATLKKYTNQQTVTLTEESVIKYFKEDMVIDYSELDQEIMFGEANQDEQIEEGWIAKLCACLSKKNDKKSNQKTEPTTKKEAMRLLAISKVQLTNTDYQMFLLKEIWTLSTHKPFARYGNHWNEIGFQGRDPATDLRSTGVLSLLQLYIYMKKHPQFAQKQHNWTVQCQFPWALTHIKISGLFLQLLRKGAISGNWEQLQSWYNALSYGMFSKVMSQFKAGEQIGTIVESGIKEMKGNWSQYKNKYEKWVNNEK